MTQTYYDPDAEPNPREWLALPGRDRFRVVQNYHIAKRLKLRNSKIHAYLHVAVEDQLASGYGPSKRAVKRLMAEGQSRHDAVHAIGMVISKFMYHSAEWRADDQHAASQARMGEAIESLRGNTGSLGEDDA
ncbi:MULTISPECIES: hypothetical protein [unclassified Duganella]|uniref:hypothetical protein n=1 Tax=unclassified Duganella TaxID=2636909 RepID=UPI0006F29092|nr:MULTISPECIES: hypothetical protein [unclassified Duganella]KQV55033.1 hypothetical protein ASD07_28355 [Duganella sp. Root336D2]KRB94324.1 hypothetical protein ASE26_26885 [Duganella sp. Root198D2]